MRPFASVVLLIATSMCASAQTETPAKRIGQEITLERLQGATISGVVNYAGRFRNRLGESPATIA